MTELTTNGLRIDTQDLSTVSPLEEDDDRMFHHDGSSSITTTGGGSTTERGYYVWDHSESAWHAVFKNADKLDGNDSSDFLHRDGSLAMLADLDAGHYGLINTDSVSSGTGQLLLNANHAILEANTAGANVRLKDSNGLLLLDALEGGIVNVPNGELREQGSRVATRTWTNANADVPNADYADDAGTLGGSAPSAFLNVAGDQMEGILDLGGFDVNDGGTTKYDASAGEIVQSALGGPAGSLTSYPLPNGDLSNSSVTVSAGNQLTGGGSVSLGGSVTVDVDETGLNADTLDGYEATSVAILSENESISGTWSFGAIPSVPADSWGEDEISYDDYSFSTPITKWSAGLSDEEIHRIELQSGESLEVRRLEIQPKGGGDVTGLDVDVYDATNAVSLASTTDVTSGDPLGTSGSGAVVIIRISNSSGNYQNASINSKMNVV